MTFQDYKTLTPEEREFFTFTQLTKIDQLDTIGDRYAGKWVEKAIIGAIIVIMTGFLGSLMYVISWNTNNASASVSATDFTTK